MKNRSTIIYTMNIPGFKYHVIKGELKKGTIISKANHPIEYVNEYRNKLYKEKKLLDCGNHYVLRKTIRVGALMAYNLFSGKLECEMQSSNDIVINHNDQKIIDEFAIENIYSTDAILRTNDYMDSVVVEEIDELSIDFSCLSPPNPDEFSDVEQLFYNVLISEKIIDSNSRHGIAKNNECDIVDEKNKIQVEIITEFKNRIKGDKKPHKNVEMFMIEAVDNNLIHSSSAIMKKFCEKKYLDNYEKQLGIFCFGTKKSVVKMLKVLQSNLENVTIKNNFAQVYIIWYDFIYDQYFFYPFHGNIKKLENINLGIVNKRKISIEDMKNKEKYLLVLKSMFKNEISISYLTKEEILKRLKTLRVLK